MFWPLLSTKTKKNLNDMNSTLIAVRLAAIAITAAINYGCLIGTYKIIVRDMRIAREDIPKIASVYIIALLLSGGFILLAVALLLIESGYVERWK